MVWVIRRGDCAEHGVGIHFRRPGVGCRGYRYIFDRDFSRLGLCRPIRGNSTEAFLRGKTRRMSALMTAAAAALMIGLSGCATPPKDDPEAMAAFEQTNDPYEPFNRGMFEFNLVLDKVVLKPVAFVYKEAVPDPIRNMIRNFLDNLRSPIIFANDMLQGEFGRAGDTLIRFVMNSSFGVLGIADFAGGAGIEAHDEDFGQTLAVWGVDNGPYLMLPLLGPSNPRDAMGRLVDFLLDPFTYAGETEFGIGRFVMDKVDERAQFYDTINELERTSLDFYAAVRSLYRQRR